MFFYQNRTLQDAVIKEDKRERKARKRRPRKGEEEDRLREREQDVEKMEK